VTSAQTAAVGALLGLLYYAVTMAGSAVVTLLAAVGAGSLSVLVVQEARMRTKPRLPGSVLVAGGGTLAGAVLGVTVQPDPIPWVGVVLAVLSAWTVHQVWRSHLSPRCSICKRPVQVLVTCPRCRQCVCGSRDCWFAAHARCRLCEERDVIALPLSNHWWIEQLGKPVTTGACQHCLKEAAGNVLHECGRCHWTTCRRCWDYNNGRCSRCGWIIPGLPETLRSYVR